MKMNDIKERVIVSVYGVEKYLSRCLDGLTGQIFRKSEMYENLYLVLVIRNYCQGNKTYLDALDYDFL